MLGMRLAAKSLQEIVIAIDDNLFGMVLLRIPAPALAHGLPHRRITVEFENRFRQILGISRLDTETAFGLLHHMIECAVAIRAREQGAAARHDFVHLGRERFLGRPVLV